MIFLAAATEPTVFLLLTDQDVADMRGGRTKWVDPRQTGGATFTKVVLSLHRNHEEAKELIRKAGHGRMIPDQLPEPQPDATEARCKGCKGVMKAYMLFEGMCVSCWKEKADHYELAWRNLVGA